MNPISMPLTSSHATGQVCVVRPKPERSPRRRRALRSVEEEEALTRREDQVLSCFAQGLNTADVARLLSISPTTVRNHAQRILAKLHVHSRLEAVARGYASGLLTISAAGPEASGKKRRTKN